MNIFSISLIHKFFTYIILMNASILQQNQSLTKVVTVDCNKLSNLRTLLCVVPLHQQGYISYNTFSSCRCHLLISCFLSVCTYPWTIRILVKTSFDKRDRIYRLLLVSSCYPHGLAH